MSRWMLVSTHHLYFIQITFTLSNWEWNFGAQKWFWLISIAFSFNLNNFLLWLQLCFAQFISAHSMSTHSQLLNRRDNSHSTRWKDDWMNALESSNMMEDTVRCTLQNSDFSLKIQLHYQLTSSSNYQIHYL
jgi:hypothetical protein